MHWLNACRPAGGSGCLGGTAITVDVSSSRKVIVRGFTAITCVESWGVGASGLVHDTTRPSHLIPPMLSAEIAHSIQVFRGETRLRRERSVPSGDGELTLQSLLGSHRQVERGVQRHPVDIKCQAAGHLRAVDIRDNEALLQVDQDLAGSIFDRDFALGDFCWAPLGRVLSQYGFEGFCRNPV